MRNALSGLTLILVIVTLAGCESVQSRNQVNVNWERNQRDVKSVGVLEFDWKPPEVHVTPDISSGYLSDAGAVVSDIVASELMKVDRYAIRERSDLKRVLEEHALQLSDVVAKGDYKLIGRLANVDAVVVGRVAVANTMRQGIFGQVEGSFSCRCVSTQTGDVLWSMGGDTSVMHPQHFQAPSHWIRLLTQGLVQELKAQLDHPPSARQ